MTAEKHCIVQENVGESVVLSQEILGGQVATAKITELLSKERCKKVECIEAYVRDRLNPNTASGTECLECERCHFRRRVTTVNPRLPLR